MPVRADNVIDSYSVVVLALNDARALKLGSPLVGLMHLDLKKQVLCAFALANLRCVQ